jgi:hypothetical protein
MKTVSSSIMAALVVVALFWGKLLLVSRSGAGFRDAPACASVLP